MVNDPTTSAKWPVTFSTKEEIQRWNDSFKYRMCLPTEAQEEAEKANTDKDGMHSMLHIRNPSLWAHIMKKREKHAETVKKGAPE